MQLWQQFLNIAEFERTFSSSSANDKLQQNSVLIIDSNFSLAIEK